jgi:hypothetical protein
MFAARSVLTSAALLLRFNPAHLQNTPQFAGAEVKVPMPFAIEETTPDRTGGISDLACLASGDSERH